MPRLIYSLSTTTGFRRFHFASDATVCTFLFTNSSIHSLPLSLISARFTTAFLSKQRRSTRHKGHVHRQSTTPENISFYPPRKRPGRGTYTTAGLSHVTALAAICSILRITEAGIRVMNVCTACLACPLSISMCFTAVGGIERGNSL
jgi:hypothetical protein